MTTADDPDQIRRDIERTQRDLSGDVDALTEKVTPRRVVERRVDRVRGRIAGLRDTVMGSGPSPSPAERARTTAGTATDRAGAAGSAISDAASTAGGAVSDAASTTVGTIQEAPDTVRRQTRGNPLAAGLIAFGAGWLVSSLLPASRREQELAAQAKGAVTDVAQPIAQRVGDAAKEVGDNLRGPAEDAARSVRESASSATAHVTEEGRQAAGQVQGRAQDAGDTVRRQAGPS
jgi:hypothetical protein